MARALANDISVLVVPSAQRALAPDRAYLGLVTAQSFAKGRDSVLGQPRIQDHVEQDAATGVVTPVTPSWSAASAR
jgi:hypothetical protein